MLCGLFTTMDNNNGDLEWQQIEEAVLDYEDLVSDAAYSGIGGQTYFISIIKRESLLPLKSLSDGGVHLGHVHDHVQLPQQRLRG